MSESNWRRYIAPGLIAAIVLLLAAITLDAWLFAEDRVDPRSESYGAKYNYKQASQDSASWSRSIKSKGESKKPDEDGAKSADDGEPYHSSLDLAAQWLAAESGRRMVRVSFWQLVIGFIGLVALSVSLWFTYRATNAAIKAVQVTEDTAKLELRAYVTVRVKEQSALVHEMPSGRMLLPMEAINTGQTPARNLRFRSNIVLSLMPLPDDFDFSIPVAPNPSFVTLGRDQIYPMTVSGPRSFSQEDVINAAQGVGPLHILTYGIITYETIFGVEQYTNFCLYSVWSRNSVVWTPTRIHNDSN